MPSNRRPGVIVAALALLLGFFLPWFDIIYFSVSPFKMITGMGSYALNGLELFLWPIPICAVLLLVNEFSDSAPLRGIEKFLKVAPLISWGLFSLIVANKVSGSIGGGGAKLMFRGLMEVAEIGFYLTLIGVGWLLVLFFNPSKTPLNTAISSADPATVPPMAAAPVAFVQSVPAPRPVPAGPTATEQLGKALAQTGALMARNRRVVLASTAVLVGGYLLYALFIKPNPEREGKTLAQKFCDCQQETLEAQIRVKQVFATKKAAAPGVQEALRDSLARIEERHEVCQQSAKAAVNAKLADYLSEPENAAALQGAIQANRALWTSADSIRLRNMNAQLARAGYDKYGPRFTDRAPVGSDESNTTLLYTDVMPITASGIEFGGSFTLELPGWVFYAKPQPIFVSKRSGVGRFKISVSDTGVITAAEKISGSLSVEQEKECREVLTGSKMTRTYSGEGGTVGYVTFNFEFADNHEVAVATPSLSGQDSGEDSRNVPERVDNSPLVDENHLYSLTGTVGDQPVVASLTQTQQSDNIVSGQYSFPNHPEWPVYELRGTRTGEGYFSLNEYTRGKVSANISLTRQGACLSGTMRNTDGREFPMRLCTKAE